ncbi:MAG: fibronectin type III domain-containing protein, partial [Thermoguttaceae bacterium]|nr:fibronectin type III domain-containing protein [Thermoguttaceae bacterium]
EYRVSAFNNFGASAAVAATGSQAVDSIFVGNGAAVSGVELETVLTDDGAEGALAYDASKPLFADAENGDYSLVKNAQAIDLATGTSASETDLAGAARVSGAAADLGAYEYQGVAPSAPTDVKFGAYDAAKQSATLTWADVADETGYRVEAKIDGKWTVVKELAADATSFDATDLAANASYEYRVSAFNNFGASAAVAATVSTLIAPNAPTDLVLSQYDATAGTLIMKWNDNADNEAVYVAVSLAGSQVVETHRLEAGATGVKFTSVDPSKSYVFRVYASNAAGDSDVVEATFNASTDVLTGLKFSTDAPKVGDELAITVAPTTAQVALQWFRVDASGKETAIEGATSATYTPTNADLGLTLKVVATGLNAAYASTVSATSGVVEEKLTAPSAPSDVKFGEYDAEAQSATLTWVDNADVEAGYKVEAKVDGAWKVVATLDANATSYVATDLAAGTTYEYRVSAFNDAGASAAVEASITTPKDEEPEPQTPAAPSNIVFGAYDAVGVALPMSWTDNSDDETAFVVQYSIDGGKTWRAAATTKANVAERVASRVWEDTSYMFRVCARNANGDSDWTYASFSAEADAFAAPSFSTSVPALDEAISAVFESEKANATFQWYRVEADGTETLIEGATNAEYQPTAAD